MALSSVSEGFREALAVGLGRLEEGLAVLAVSSPLITNLNCLGARGGVCQCLPEQKRGNPSWCIPPIPMPLVTAEQVAVAVRVVWPKIVAEASQIDLTADTVARVNAQLRGAAGMGSTVTFDDAGNVSRWPKSGDSTGWSGLIAELQSDHDDEWKQQWEDELGCYIMAELAWNQHVPALGLTTGCLMAVGWRLARGLEVYAPDPDRTERTLQALDGTRPGLWDAEDFRGMWPQHY